MSPNEATRVPERAARAILRAAIAQRICPAAVAEVGDGRRVLWREAFGTLTFEPGSERTAEDTVFDLASLTKPVATTSSLLQLLAGRVITLDDLASRAFPEWSAADRARTRVQDLLEHASGLPARLVDAPPRSRREFEHDICTTPLEYAPRTRSVYSDLGFILLGFLAEDRGESTLPDQVAAILDRIADRALEPAEAGAVLTFEVPADRRAGVAPTRPLPEDDRRGRLLVGEVHDQYAALLGGAAGHAGLFGNAAALGAFARAALRGVCGDALVPSPLSPDLMRRTTRPSTVPGSSRALGWDTMRPTSSCGTKMSREAFGHVGFTGTSLWIDPILDRYFILLTNRACGGGTSEELQTLRRGFHDAAATG